MSQQPKTELADRTLRFDGISILHPHQVEDFLLRGLKPHQLLVHELSDELQAFNQKVIAEDRIHVDDDRELLLDQSWKLPSKYLSLNVQQHVLEVFGERLPALAYDSAQTELAINRVALELAEFETRGLNDLLRTLIYVLDRFRESNQVFGVGRGSSCASFVLFLLGLHVVDVIKHDVPMEEFFHD